MKNFNISLNEPLSNEELAKKLTRFVNGPFGQDWIPVIENAVPKCMDRVGDISSLTTPPTTKHYCDEKIAIFFECMKEQQFLV